MLKKLILLCVAFLFAFQANSNAQLSFTRHVVANIPLPSMIYPVDLDDDSDIDILGITWGHWYPGQIIWWENDASEDFTEHYLHTHYRIGRSIATADFDDDSDKPNDFQGADFDTPDVGFNLRAERPGKGYGRVYTITYTATDQSGNRASAEVYVTVPDSKSKKEAMPESHIALPESFESYQNHPKPSPRWIIFFADVHLEARFYPTGSIPKPKSDSNSPRPAMSY